MPVQIQKPWRNKCLHDRLALQREMVATHPTGGAFTTFKKHIREHLLIEGLDGHKTKDQQNPKKWAKFVHKIIELHPALSVYQDYWPIQEYFDTYTIERKKKRDQRHKRRLQGSKDNGEVDIAETRPRKEDSDVEIMAITSNGNDSDIEIIGTQTREDIEFISISSNNDKRNIAITRSQPYEDSSDVEIIAITSNNANRSTHSQRTQRVEKASKLNTRPKHPKPVVGPLDHMFRAMNERSLAVISQAAPPRDDAVEAVISSCIDVGTVVKAQSKSSSKPAPRTQSPCSDITGAATVADVTPLEISPSTPPPPDSFIPTFVSCIQCDISAVADSLYNPRLRAFVQDQELLDSLAAIGVRFDQHLDLLLRMKRTTLEMFFVEHVPTSKMDVYTRWRLLYLFINATAFVHATVPLPSANLSTEVPTNADAPICGDDGEQTKLLTHIPVPALEDEMMITSYAYFGFRVSLQYAMQLDDDDALFGRLLDTLVETCSRHFLEPAPDESSLEKIIELICSSSPGHFERYANYWPIRLYLTWFVKQIPVICPKYTETEQSEVFMDAFSKKVLRSLLLTIGPMSGTVDVSSPGLRSQVESTSAFSSRPLPPNPQRAIKQLPCPNSPACISAASHLKHPFIRTSLACPEIHAYMHQQALGELIPVLVYLGVHSEAHFALLRKAMSPTLYSSSMTSAAEIPTAEHSSILLPFDAMTDRNVLLNSPKLKQLGDFQKFLLTIAFDIDKGVDHFLR